MSDRSFCFMLLVTALLIVAAWSASVRAEPIWQPDGSVSFRSAPENRAPTRRRTVRRVVRNKSRYKVRRTIRVAPRREPVAPICRAEVRAVGRQAVTLAGAKANAVRAFQETARFRLGELYADIRSARGVYLRCVKSTVRGGFQRATEAVGIDASLERCSIRATPCIAQEIEP